MENLEEDLKEECIISPIYTKKIIYRQPVRFNYPSTNPKPSKVKVFTMNEKFDFTLNKITTDLCREYTSLPLKSQDRIKKLFNAYHEWQWPMWSNTLHRMGRELGQDVTRLARLLQQAKLITNNKDMLGKTPYQWNKLPFTSEEVLETLIIERNDLTAWEKEYYTCANRRNRKSRVKKSDAVLKDRREKIIKAIDNSSFNVQEDEQMDEAFDEMEAREQVPQEDPFITMLNERYYMFKNVFPDTSLHELQKIFLTLILSEYEK